VDILECLLDLMRNLWYHFRELFSWSDIKGVDLKEASFRSDLNIETMLLNLSLDSSSSEDQVKKTIDFIVLSCITWDLE